MKKTIGFIGAGNMASAIIGGMVSSGNFSGEEICVYDTDIEKTGALNKKYGLCVCQNNIDICEKCHAVLLAVKPVALPELLPSLTKTVEKEKNLIISIAAGQSVERLRSLLDCFVPIIRVMPNINALASQAVSGYTANELANEEHIALAEKILNSTGKAVRIDESLFSVYSAVAGCSPAYIYSLINTASEVGVKYGLYKSVSLDIVTNAVKNCAEKLSEGNIEDNINEFLSNEKNSAVTEKLEKNDFKNLVFQILDAALNKDKKM